MRKFFTVFFIVWLICFPAFATESEETAFYITEETTQWDVVEATDPNHDEIPDEIKQQMQESYVLQTHSAPAIFLAVKNDALLPIGIGVLLLAIVLVVFVVMKLRK